MESTIVVWCPRLPEDYPVIRAFGAQSRLEDPSL